MFVFLSQKLHHVDYIRQSGGYAIKSVCLSFCLSVYVQDYCKSNQPISLKLDSVYQSEELLI